jgi:Protein of unknown function (DUF4197)
VFQKKRILSQNNLKKQLFLSHMKKIILSLFLLFSLSGCASGQGLGSILGKANEVLNGGKSNPLSSEEIARGLKEALSVGINNSSTKASALDGFLGNEAIKLLFPPEARAAEQKLRAIGLGGECDKFITALNRGAEEAAKKAAPIFVDAITQMTIQDAVGILRGDKDAATQYLKRTSTQQLTNAFAPVMDNALNQTMATKYYTEIANTYNKIPFTSNKINPDLKAYATQKAIDGLFMLVAQEEAKIRENPAARVTDLLKRVFIN